ARGNRRAPALLLAQPARHARKRRGGRGGAGRDRAHLESPGRPSDAGRPGVRRHRAPGRQRGARSDRRLGRGLVLRVGRGSERRRRRDERLSFARPALVVCLLAAVVPAAPADEAKTPAATPAQKATPATAAPAKPARPAAAPDDELLEFLGSVDSEEGDE